MSIGYYCGNTINDLRSGHFKNSYGVEGMNITGRTDWKRIVDVSDEMKAHVLKDVKMGYYKYGGMSGDNKAEEDAYYDKIHNYIKSVNKSDRSAVGWTLSQLHLDLANAVKTAVQKKIPSWTPGQQIPSDVLDEIFADESITSIMSRYSSAGAARNTDTIEISDEGRLAAEQAKVLQVDSAPEEDEELAERQGGKVAVNQGKRARQIAAAQSRDQVQQVLALLQKDMADCKAGLAKGWCDEAEIAKVEALIGQAKARMGQVPEKADNSLGGLSAFDLASLM